jgi:hypothetical protein
MNARTPLILLLAFAAFSHVSCACNSTEGFLTEQPTPSLDDEHFLINLTEIVGEQRTGDPLILNLLKEETLNVTLLAPSDIYTGIWDSWTLGNNGNIEAGILFLGDSSWSQITSLLLCTSIHPLSPWQ